MIKVESQAGQYLFVSYYRDLESPDLLFNVTHYSDSKKIKAIWPTSLKAYQMLEPALDAFDAYGREHVIVLPYPLHSSDPSGLRIISDFTTDAFFLSITPRKVVLETAQPLKAAVLSQLYRGTVPPIVYPEGLENAFIDSGIAQ